MLPDPRRAISDEDRKAKWDALMKVGALNDRNITAIEKLRRTRTDIDAVLARLKPVGAPADAKEDPARADLRKSAAALNLRLDAVEKLLWIPPKTKGIVEDLTVNSKIDYADGALSSTWDKPTSSQLAYLARAEKALQAAEAEVAKLYTEDVAKFREAVRAAKVDLLAE